MRDSFPENTRTPAFERPKVEKKEKEKEKDGKDEKKDDKKDGTSHLTFSRACIESQEL